MSLAIHGLLDDIEIKTKTVITKDILISRILIEWQNGKLPDDYFKRVLEDYLDILENHNE